MNFIIDIIVILIFLACIFFGYKRGLTGVIIKVLSFVLSIVISLILFKPVSAIIIDHTDIYNNLSNSIKVTIQEDEKEEKTNSEKPNVMLDSINEKIEETEEDATTAIANNIAEIIINIIVLVILFIVIRIILFFIRFIFSAITELPIIKQIDKLGGFIYGLLEALLIVFVILAVISFIDIPELQLAIKTSIITSILYNNNLLLMLFF